MAFGNARPYDCFVEGPPATAANRQEAGLLVFVKAGRRSLVTRSSTLGASGCVRSS